MQKLSAWRKRASEVPCLRSIRSSFMRVICPVGPPKEKKPSQRVSWDANLELWRGNCPLQGMLKPSALNMGTEPSNNMRVDLIVSKARRQISAFWIS